MNTNIQTSKVPIEISTSLLKGIKVLFLMGMVAGITVFAQPVVADMTVCASGCTYTNIQNAINAAPDDGVIRIRTGIYEEKLEITDKRLQLIGSGSAVTIIDATKFYSKHDTASVIDLYCTTEKRVAIDGITVNGGGPAYRNIGGGGISNYGCKVVVNNCLITGNSSKSGAGIDNNSGIMSIWNTVISNNENNGGPAAGAGIRNLGIMEVTKSSIINNSSSGMGGGISNEGTLTGSDVTIANNSARQQGGGISSGSDVSKITVADYRLLNNQTYGWQGFGGGLLSNGDFTIRYSLLLYNSAIFGGGIYNETLGNIKLVGDFVIHNAAVDATDGTKGDGGGLFNAIGSSVRLTEGTTILNNVPNNCNDGICP